MSATWWGLALLGALSALGGTMLLVRYLVRSIRDDVNYRAAERGADEIAKTKSPDDAERDLDAGKF